MGRVLILLLLVVLAVWLVRRAARRAEPRSEAAAGERTSDELVRCVQCGVLLPRAEARMAAGALYCSEEHVRLGPAASPNAGKGPR